MPLSGTFGQNFHKRHSFVFHLQLNGFLNRPFGTHPLFVIVQCYPFHVNGAIHLSHNFRHAQWRAVHSIPPVRCGGCFLTGQRGRRHLSACHGIIGIVNENYRYRNTQFTQMHNFRQPNGRQVAISLVADDDTVGVGNFMPHSHCRGPTVRRLGVAHVQIIIQKYRTPDWRNIDGAVLNTQFFNHFGNVFMHNPMAAARTIVGGMGFQTFAMGMSIKPWIKYRFHDNTPSS